MHELSIAQSIMKVVQRHLPAGGNRHVKLVRLRVGDQAGIVPESLAFCFALASDGTALRGAKLEIEPVPGDALNVVDVELEE